ncbi:MAG: NifU family protein [Cyclobacteriaceae bacterium]|jgi:Fe-S cluster biogenesis protein NfuA|nr:NifU family protein [Cyclobacteriaceae bacterium]
MSIAELTSKVENSLNSIRPYLEADGGNVRVAEVTAENVVKLEFVGACSSCPMSTMTFKAGVEEAIRKSVPEVSKIEVINLTPISR